MAAKRDIAALAGAVMTWLTLAAAATPPVDPAEQTLSDGGADSCLGCHNHPRMTVIFKTAHGQRSDPDAPMASLECERCHGAGDDHADRRRTRGHPQVISFGRTAKSSAEVQNEVCTGCHADEVGLTWHGSVHDRSDTTCVSCHSVHTRTDPVALQSSQADVCFSCHERQRSDSRKPSTHPIRFNAMICTDCHDPHASVSSGQLIRDTTNELCHGCHTEYRGPFLFEHAPVAEDCTLCHEPHGSIHAPLLSRRQPLLCQSCHSQRGHPSLSFTSDSLPGGNPSAMVLGQSCMNCHSQVHGSNHPSGFNLMR